MRGSGCEGERRISGFRINEKYFKNRVTGFLAKNGKGVSGFGINESVRRLWDSPCFGARHPASVSVCGATLVRRPLVRRITARTKRGFLPATRSGTPAELQKAQAASRKQQRHPRGWLWSGAGRCVYRARGSGANK